ncbi:hypothetical protein CEXT_465601 [Caerostris extrusa]|uniref:Uncharacterized protein n=1 Tax=Caerostris extrusa TaxID=172846 RepID=A0AAV4NGQ6_CAEEX|nr:hypothetical protein CEXT_465601 [Caerostris extrusa]
MHPIILYSLTPSDIETPPKSTPEYIPGNKWNCFKYLSLDRRFTGAEKYKNLMQFELKKKRKKKKKLRLCEAPSNCGILSTGAIPRSSQA